MNTKTNTLLSQNLARLRTMNGLTQDAVAEQLGVTRQAVAKWEAGKSVPDMKYGAALADFYSVTLDDLYRYDEASEGVPIPPKGKHVFGLTTVGERGEIVLPKKCMDLFQLTAGKQLLVLADTNPENKGIALVSAELIPTLQDFIDRAREEAK